MYCNQDFIHIILLENKNLSHATYLGRCQLPHSWQCYTYLDNAVLELRHSFISSIYAVLQHNKMKFMCEPKLKILILETITSCYLRSPFSLHISVQKIIKVIFIVLVCWWMMCWEFWIAHLTHEFATKW